MRARSSLLLVALLLPISPAIQAQAPAQISFDAAGTQAEHVSSFLKTLQTAVAVDNRQKVASLVKYPLTLTLDGEPVTLRNSGDLLARYSRVFDAAMKQAIAAARVESLKASAEGIKLDDGRLCCLPEDGKPKVIRIVAIAKPQ